MQTEIHSTVSIVSMSSARSCLPDDNVSESHVDDVCGCRITPNSPSFNTIWCNAAAKRRFGRLFTKQEHAAILEAYPPAANELYIQVANRLHETCVVSLKTEPALA